MTNQEIEELEFFVTNLDSKLKLFSSQLDTRTRDNYNHLGTLDVNLKSLRRKVDKLIKELGYRP